MSFLFFLGMALAAGGIQNSPVEIERMPVSSVDAAQQRGWLNLRIEGVMFRFHLGFSAASEPYLLIREEGRAVREQGWDLGQLAQGAEYHGEVELRIKRDNGTIRISLMDPSRPYTSFSVATLLNRVYAVAVSPRIPLVHYAILHDTGPPGLLPASFSTLRRDWHGQYWVGTYPEKEVSGRVAWLVSVNGILYGMSLKDRTLYFYSKPGSASYLKLERPLFGFY